MQYCAIPRCGTFDCPLSYKKTLFVIIVHAACMYVCMYVCMFECMYVQYICMCVGFLAKFRNC